MKYFADISFFNELIKNPQKRFFTFNEPPHQTNIMDKIKIAVEDWMDEIEDMRALDPSTEDEAAGEEVKLQDMLQKTYDEITEAVSVCRLEKVRLQQGRAEQVAAESVEPEEDVFDDFVLKEKPSSSAPTSSET